MGEQSEVVVVRLLEWIACLPLSLYAILFTYRVQDGNGVMVTNTAV